MYIYCVGGLTSQTRCAAIVHHVQYYQAPLYLEVLPASQSTANASVPSTPCCGPICGYRSRAATRMRGALSPTVIMRRPHSGIDDVGWRCWGCRQERLWGLYRKRSCEPLHTYAGVGTHLWRGNARALGEGRRAFLSR